MSGKSYHLVQCKDCKSIFPLFYRVGITDLKRLEDGYNKCLECNSKNTRVILLWAESGGAGFDPFNQLCYK
jgi:hypothetical protein